MSRPTLGADERIKSTKTFDGLFQNGSSFFLQPLRVIYKFEDFEDAVPAKAAFVAPKRVFKSAVERNRIKRCMREAYRQLKPALYERLLHQNRKLLLVFVFQRYVEKTSTSELSLIISKVIDRLTLEPNQKAKDA